MLHVIQNVAKTLKLGLCSSRDGVLYGDHTLFQEGSNDTTFDHPSVPLDSTFSFLFPFRALPRAGNQLDGTPPPSPPRNK